jgi:DNA polymerase III delta prime subunit
MARGKVQKSVIGDIAAAANRAGITIDTLNAKRGSKDVLYEYGMREILNISPRDIKKAIEVYNDAKANKITDKVQKTILAIRENKNIEKKLKEQLPKTITAVFSREASKRLNNDKVSLEIVEEVLAGKNFLSS